MRNVVVQPRRIRCQIVLVGLKCGHGECLTGWRGQGCVRTLVVRVAVRLAIDFRELGAGNDRLNVVDVVWKLVLRTLQRQGVIILSNIQV